MSTLLPTPITRFVGRACELRELRGLLQTERLITLTGPGGSGKTRLALQLASAGSPDAHWIDLVALTDSTQLPLWIRRELDLGEHPDRSVLDLAIEYLRDRSVLLVFDNCERISSAVASLAQELLDHCAGIKIVATSLQPLDLPHEKIYAVPPLSTTPLPFEENSRTETGDRGKDASDAAQLFIDRAREVLPSFEVNADQTALIDTICRRLDGLPLAIELAAARVKVLSLAQIADRVEDALKLLTRGTPAQSARHQTLRAVMEWSYRFLAEAEQTLLRRLAIFSGSFSLDMIEAVCAGDGLSSLDVLSDLADKALVVLESPTERSARYHLLETIRQYAYEQLEAAGEAQLLRDRLLSWATALAEQSEAELVGPRQREWLPRLTADYGNLRAALESAGQSEAVTPGLRLAAALGRYWWARGEFSEGLYWLEMFLDRSNDAPSVAVTRAKAYQYAAAYLYRQGHLARALPYAERSLTLRRPLDNDRDIAESLNLLGIIASDSSEYARAEEYYLEALRLRQATSEVRGTAVVLGNLGYVSRLQGKYDRAHEFYQQSLAHYRQCGDARGIATILNNLGNIQLTRGDLAGARPLYEESLALSQQLDDQWGLVRATSSLAVLALNLGEHERAASLLQETRMLGQAINDEMILASTSLNLGLLAYLQNDYGRAATYYEDALTRWRAMKHQWGLGQTLNELGRLVCEQGDVPRAVQLLREGLLLYQKLDHTEGLADALEGLAAVATRQQHYSIAVRRLAVAARLRERARVPALPPQQAQIDRLIAAARTALGSSFDRVWAASASLEAQAVVAEVLAETAPSAPADDAHRATLEPELRILALGPTRVLAHDRVLASTDWTYTKAKELLFYFIARPPAAKAQIGLDLWPDASAEQLRNIFHRALHHLRKALGQPDWIVFADEVYSFNRSLNYWCDVDEFERHLCAAQTADRAQAAQQLEAASALWRGDFAEDLDVGDWVIFKREELRERYVQALLDLGALYFIEAQYDRAVAAYRRLLSLDNYLELAHRELMRCFVRQGEVGHALQHYQHLREMLQRELQAEPSPETVTLYERIKRGENV